MASRARSRSTRWAVPRPLTAPTSTVSRTSCARPTRPRSPFGVAFGGCTLPGADAPLFTVAPGRMDFGLGIHGEPGISTKDWMSAGDLAVKLTDTVLAERPGGADGRAAVLLNGLGATKYEELAALFGSVADLLSRRGVELVMPEVELVTSLDMAGCSLTVTWLDDELARLWTAPAATPAFRRGALDDGARFTTHRRWSQPTPRRRSPSRQQARRRWPQLTSPGGRWRRCTASSRRTRTCSARSMQSPATATTALECPADPRRPRGLHNRPEAVPRRCSRPQERPSQTPPAGPAASCWGMLLDGIGKSLGHTEAVNAERVAAAVHLGDGEQPPSRRSIIRT